MDKMQIQKQTDRQMYSKNALASESVGVCVSERMNGLK